LNGSLGTGQIVECFEDQIQLNLQLSEDPPPAAPMTLILALPRPKYLGRILQSVTTLGVKSIHLINSFRVEKSFWQSQQLDEISIREELLLGLEQSRDTVLPEVYLHRGFKPFVEDIAPGLLKNSQGLVAHPGCRIRHESRSQNGPIDPFPRQTLAVGPEGGWIDYEVEKFLEAGFQIHAWGERTLKIETALVALISRLLP
ncbi:MAG: RNA methyltransferase, partial [Bdellovibrionales bacterium]|nr:RNA methyltransferase [Bdellovibrionales bacterium]